MEIAAGVRDLKNRLLRAAGPLPRRETVRESLLPTGTRRRSLYRLCAKSIKILMRLGLRDFLRKAVHKLRRCLILGEPFLVRVEPLVELNRQYSAWLQTNKANARDPAAMKIEVDHFAYKPVISIVTPVFNVAEVWLRKAIESVMDQIYPYWELCLVDDGSTEPHVSLVLNEYAARDRRVKTEFLEENSGIGKATGKALEMAQGEFVAFLDHDDELAPEALLEIVKRLNQDPDLDLVYSDEDKIEPDGSRVEPYFKPDWSPDLLLSTNYVCHLSVFRKRILDEVGGMKRGFEGSQDFDLLLRFTEATNRIGHIPKVLYHWRKIITSAAASETAKPHAFKAGRKALKEALIRRKFAGRVEILGPGRYRVRYRVEGEPLVSIIIPTKDHVDLLKSCISSIVQKSSYSNYEILVVDNDSCEPDTLQYLSEIAGVHHVLRYRRTFNWSAINNFAAHRSRGDYLLFLNNDVEVIESGWIEAMLEHAQRGPVGAVGAKLFYRDNRIQHAGVILGICGASGHAFRDLPAYSGGYLEFANLTRNCSAVTGACMMMRREVFSAVGGFDERFRVANGDIDFCLRVREKGYVVVYTPYARLYHHESATRGIIHPIDDDDCMHRQWGKRIAEGDPYYNPNFSLVYEDFRLRL